jgi:hypothetical protein
MLRKSTILLTAGLAGVTAVVAIAAGCSKASAAPSQARAQEDMTPVVSAPAPRDGHAASDDNYFVDSAPDACTAGSVCTLRLKLTATGDYHINDEYPYKFKADDSAGVEFQGTDSNGKNVFSKAAGDWSKDAEKTGTMTVKFKPADKGSKTIAGTFKLSVCSQQNCLLKQAQLSVSVTVR